MLEATFPVCDYDLAGTLASGQAFRWRHRGDAWEGVVGGRWVRLSRRPRAIVAQTAEPVSDWAWLGHYLQIDANLAGIIATFPKDDPMQTAVRACHGLRLLRQEPWECLASFILSATKRIVQIQRIVELLCRRFGEPVGVPPGHEPEFSFPSCHRIAALTEIELRACKMGFRAPNLLKTAQIVSRGELNLGAVRNGSIEEARAQLMRLPGVGRKIADCVLLFGCGFQKAFPVDVWVLKALRELYFPGRRVTLKGLMRFSETHFGPHAGCAQQYLFHYMRTRRNIVLT